MRILGRRGLRLNYDFDTLARTLFQQRIKRFGTQNCLGTAMNVDFTLAGKVLRLAGSVEAVQPKVALCFLVTVIKLYAWEKL